MKHGRTLTELAQELDRQLKSRKDMLVPNSLFRHSTDETGRSTISVEARNGMEGFGITNLARRQLAEKIGIPFGYFERMRESQPDLLDRNVNTWLLAQPDERRMLRTLDGDVRAVLSDRYRRLDNWDLADHVLPFLSELPGAKIESIELTDTRMYIKVVTEKVQFEIEPGDVVQAGVVISNSEVGCGTLSVQPLIFRLVCTNGLIVPDAALKRHHLGRAINAADDTVTVFADDTLAADDKALFLKVRDVVRSAVSEATFRVVAEKFAKTKGIELVGKVEQTVEILANKYALSETEGAGILRSLIKGGDLSGYGLINAVTHYSQEIPDYDRATDFEMLGGRLLAQSEHDWKRLVTTA